MSHHGIVLSTGRSYAWTKVKLCRIPGYRRYQPSRAMKVLVAASETQTTRTLKITHHVHEAWRQDQEMQVTINSCRMFTVKGRGSLKFTK